MEFIGNLRIQASRSMDSGLEIRGLHWIQWMQTCKSAHFHTLGLDLSSSKVFQTKDPKSGHWADPGGAHPACAPPKGPNFFHFDIQIL